MWHATSPRTSSVTLFLGKLIALPFEGNSRSDRLEMRQCQRLSIPRRSLPKHSWVNAPCRIRTLIISSCSSLNLAYTRCFLLEPNAFCRLPVTLVDICLSGAQIYSAHLLVRGLTRLSQLEHLRLNGLATLTDTALEEVS